LILLYDNECSCFESPEIFNSAANQSFQKICRTSDNDIIRNDNDIGIWPKNQITVKFLLND